VTAYQLIGPLSLLTLEAGCTITLEAIDPSTGANVTGVTVSQVAIYGVNAVPTEINGNADVLFAYPFGDLPTA
jgi:hypothetical protein